MFRRLMYFVFFVIINGGFCIFNSVPSGEPAGWDQAPFDSSVWGAKGEKVKQDEPGLKEEPR